MSLPKKAAVQIAEAWCALNAIAGDKSTLATEFREKARKTLEAGLEDLIVWLDPQRGKE